MIVSQAKIFDSTEPLSKALDYILKTGSAVFIVKNKELVGIIDDKNVRKGFIDSSKIKCESASVRCPSIKQNADIKEYLDGFLSGHFKILPIVNEKQKITGAVSRSDLLSELCALKLVPNTSISQYMHTPVHTIEYSQTIGSAKNLMKQAKVHHLIVSSKGKIVGTFSTFDLVRFLIKPKKRQASQLVDKISNLDTLKIGEMMHKAVLIEENATLNDAAKKMADHAVSLITIIKDKKPVGVLSATDLFRIIRKFYETESDIIISGLSNDDVAYYSQIKTEINNTLRKFQKKLKIENIAIHFKKTKSVYQANVHFNINNGSKAFKREAHKLYDIIKAVCKELRILFEKAKSEKMTLKKLPRNRGEL